MRRYIKVFPRTSPWKFVPIYLYWAVFDTHAAADNARAIDIVNLVGPDQIFLWNFV